jgi:hypothetical protein
LLDHEYTPSGLRWAQLKNGDSPRTAALVEVARRLDCEVCLCLADVHETWSSEEDDYSYSRRGRRYDYDDDDTDDDDGTSEPSVNASRPPSRLAPPPSAGARPASAST